jgi:hypothetical protein
MDTPFFCDGFHTHHSGTLRCRGDGASKPLTDSGQTKDGNIFTFNKRLAINL